jgi:hypothetical protein
MRQDSREQSHSQTESASPVDRVGLQQLLRSSGRQEAEQCLIEGTSREKRWAAQGRGLAALHAQARV